MIETFVRSQKGFWERSLLRDRAGEKKLMGFQILTLFFLFCFVLFFPLLLLPLLSFFLFHFILLLLFLLSLCSFSSSPYLYKFVTLQKRKKNECMINCCPFSLGSQSKRKYCIIPLINRMKSSSIFIQSISMLCTFGSRADMVT